MFAGAVVRLRRGELFGSGLTKLGATVRRSVANLPPLTSMFAEQESSSADSVLAVSAKGYCSGFSSSRRQGGRARRWEIFPLALALARKGFAVVPGGFYFRYGLSGGAEL